MSSRLSDAIRRLPALSRPRRRVRKAIERPVAARRGPQPRAARAPYVLTLSSRRVVRRTLPEAVVPYLRMSGRRRRRSAALSGRVWTRRVARG